MKKILLAGVILALGFFSCELFELLDSKDGTNKQFWAYNMKKKDFYQLDAVLYTEGQGRYCNVWVEKGSGVSADTAGRVARAYDYDVYFKMINAFSITDFVYKGYTFANVMELADALTDNDGKLCILLLDIKDDYRKNEHEAFVGGYFWPGNLLAKTTNNRYSNECDMIYIDTNPGKPGSQDSNETLAHEMQHLMNFVTSIVTRTREMDTWIVEMDLWIDEGLATSAEWLYTGKHPASRWRWYNQNGDGKQINPIKGLIDKGNNFYVWGNREDENPYAILDDYATVYLFFQWIRLQAGANSIYKNIISSSYYDYRAVTSAVNSAIPGQGYSNWGTLLETWLAANYINSSTGPYGYKGDSTLGQIKAMYVPASVSGTIPLTAGEGVYSRIPNGGNPSLTQEGNIRYSRRSNSKEEALITYNVDTDIEGKKTANGKITGYTGVLAVTPVSDSRSIADPPLGPFPISARDALRQNGHGKNNDDDFSLLKKWFTANE